MVAQDSYSHKASVFGGKALLLGAVLFGVGAPTLVHASVFESMGSVSSLITSFFTKRSSIPVETQMKVNEQATYLSAAVNIDPNPAKGGGDIVIVGGVALLPETGPSGSIADIEGYSSSDQISLYIVREGDTLSGISKMFGVSSNTILWANDLKRGSAIRPGQALIILPVSGIRHTVKAGDTLKKIAERYKGELDEVLAFNELSLDETLSVGSIVVVPHGVMPVTVTAPTKQVGKTASSLSDPSGYFIRPVSAGIRSQGIHGYNAVDLAAPAGTPVVAAAEGTVIVSRNSGWNGGYGSYVVLQHQNGSQTLYAHLNNATVAVGAAVSQGEVIGSVGSTGRSTGNHLHFEVRGGFRNPFAY